jgi:hypothetical protein
MWGPFGFQLLTSLEVHFVGNEINNQTSLWYMYWFIFCAQVWIAMSWNMYEVTEMQACFGLLVPIMICSSLVQCLYWLSYKALIQQ